jgi:DNA-binding transcriptional MerR regulator
VAGDGLTAGAVARRLGVAVTTLRTWHQRYDLGPSGHEPGKHRRYTHEDLAKLELMQRLTADGVSPGEAARWVRDRPPSLTERRTWAGVRPTKSIPTVVVGGRGGLAMGPASPAAHGLGRAAMRLDGESVRQIASDAIRHLGVVGAWEAVLRPVLAAIGERHARTGRFIEVEHLVTGVTSDVLGAVPRPTTNGEGRVLLACTDEEQHSLPIEALAAALAQADVVCRTLGARVPPGALRAAVRRTGPAAVLLWSHQATTAEVEQVRALATGRNRPMLLAVARPRWANDDLPASVAVPQTLADAVQLLRAAV